MQKVRLICWNEELAKAHGTVLRKAGYAVDSSPLRTSGIVGHLKEISPDMVVIDLDRLPSQGREMAVMIRGSRSTRHLPLVLAGGTQEKTARVRAELPDAVFASWDEIAPALQRALRAAATGTVRPIPQVDRGSRTPLPQKLGIGAGTQVALLGAPDGFAELLGDLPEGVELVPRISRKTKLVLYFVRSADALEKALDHLAGQLPEASSAWLIYPKRGGKSAADFNQNDVRDRALPLGLVDYKVCSVSEEWSGLKFAWRKK